MTETFDELAGGITPGGGEKSAWFVVIEATGEMVGRGTSAMPKPEPGQVVRWRNDESALHADPVIIDKKAREAAQVEVDTANAQRDIQLYVDKAKYAQMFLDEDAARATPEEGVVSPTDPSVIDSSKYDLLYTEYWNTYDVTASTPWELARATVARAANNSKSVREAARRRKKLLAQAVLSAAKPEIPDE